MKTWKHNLELHRTRLKHGKIVENLIEQDENLET